MSGISSLKFTIRHPDGRIETLAVDSDIALVGSGAHCEIRLPADDSSVEQLVVETRPGGVFAEARSMNPPALLNGLPFTQGRLLPESFLQIGALEVSVEASQLSQERSTKQAKRTRTSPITYVAAFIGLPLGFYTVLKPPKESALTKPPEVPALWDTDDEVTCPQKDPEVAAALAGEDLLRADAKQERAPFSSEDGVASVGLYRRAAACLSVAGDTEAAASTQAQAERMRQSMSQQFHVHRVRLERSLATQDYDAARKEVHILLMFLHQRGGPYTTWLSNLDRHLELKFAGKKRK